MAERRRTPLSRQHRRAFPCVVSEVKQLTPLMRRITLEADEFSTYELLAADEYFGLMIPNEHGLKLPASPPTTITPRGLIALIPDHLRPDVRWYTVREHRRQERQVDVDMVLHGQGRTGGPAGNWALRAQPGDIVGFCECKGNYAPEPEDRTRLFIGDETSLPAISALLESPRPGPGTRRLDPEGTDVHIEVPTAEDIQTIASDVPVTWHIRGEGRPGTALLDALPALHLSPETDYVWLCAEALTVKQIRRHLVGTVGIDRSRILFSGYWRLGEART